MGVIYSISKDINKIMEDMKEVLTLTFKVIISVVTIVQDIENVILELKDLSDMLHFSVNAVDKDKISDRLEHLKGVAEELGKKARSKHATLDLVAMVIEDSLKLRYKKEEESINSTTSNNTAD